MKSIVFKSILLLGCILTIIFFLEYKYKSYQTPADLLFYNLEREANFISTLYIGGSHTGVIENYTKDSSQLVRNLSSQGCDVFKIYAILKKWQPQMPNLKKVYIGIDYEMLGQNQAMFGEEYLDRQFFKYTDTLYKYDFTNILMSKSNFFRANRDLSHLISNENKEIKAPNFIPLTNTVSSEIECKKRAIEHSVIKFNSKLISENLNFINSIISLAKNNSIELIVFNAPKQKCFQENVKKETSLLAKQKLDSLFEANQVKYYDFWNDSHFTDSDFGDYDHLNARGVEKLMQKLP